MAQIDPAELKRHLYAADILRGKMGCFAIKGLEKVTAGNQLFETLKEKPSGPGTT